MARYGAVLNFGGPFPDGADALLEQSRRGATTSSEWTCVASQMRARSRATTDPLSSEPI
jgi:hypothetical protein